jgi:hypothetical protein
LAKLPERMLEMSRTRKRMIPFDPPIDCTIASIYAGGAQRSEHLRPSQVDFHASPELWGFRTAC